LKQDYCRSSAGLIRVPMPFSGNSHSLRPDVDIFLI
jgi:hypothetical protein